MFIEKIINERGIIKFLYNKERQWANIKSMHWVWWIGIKLMGIGFEILC